MCSIDIILVCNFFISSGLYLSLFICLQQKDYIFTYLVFKSTEANMEKKCYNCSMMISKDAKMCHRFRKSQGNPMLGKIVIGIFLFAGIMLAIGKQAIANEQLTAPETMITTPAVPTTPAPTSFSEEHKKSTATPADQNDPAEIQRRFIRTINNAIKKA
jgi:hypothetical protein